MLALWQISIWEKSHWECSILPFTKSPLPLYVSKFELAYATKLGKQKKRSKQSGTFISLIWTLPPRLMTDWHLKTLKQFRVNLFKTGISVRFGNSGSAEARGTLLQHVVGLILAQGNSLSVGSYQMSLAYLWVCWVLFSTVWEVTWVASDHKKATH